MTQNANKDRNYIENRQKKIQRIDRKKYREQIEKYVDNRQKNMQIIDRKIYREQIEKYVDNRQIITCIVEFTGFSASNFYWSPPEPSMMGQSNTGDHNIIGAPKMRKYFWNPIKILI